MNTLEIQQLEFQHTSGVYTKRPLVIVRGEGAHLWDLDGNEYIDCVGGQGAANLGHANPSVAYALAEQSKKLISCPEMFYNDQRAILEEKICSLTGMPRIFLCNSGAEAVEAALKFSRFTTGRMEVIAAMRGFHGRTMGALSATWEKKYRIPFEPLIPGFKHIAYNDIEALQASISDKTASVILEIVQGEGGVNLGNLEFLHKAQELCLKHGAHFIVDEIQTGFGRTGKLFAYQHYDLDPDFVCVAKSMAGGVPMGACLIGKRIGEIPAMIHGSTFGGNPLACAASLAAIDYLESNQLVEKSAELGVWFLGKLKEVSSPLIRNVRGLGLMVGIELKQKVTPYLQALTVHGVLALPAGLTVLRFLPPLVISRKDLEKVANAVQMVLSEGTE